MPPAALTRSICILAPRWYGAASAEPGPVRAIDWPMTMAFLLTPSCAVADAPATASAATITKRRQDWTNFILSLSGPRAGLVSAREL